MVSILFVLVSTVAMVINTLPEMAGPPDEKVGNPVNQKKGKREYCESFHKMHHNTRKREGILAMVTNTLPEMAGPPDEKVGNPVNQRKKWKEKWLALQKISKIEGTLAISLW